MIKALVALVLSLVPSWDHPGYDAEDSYYNPHESVINAGSIAHLSRAWSVQLRRQDPSCSGPSAPLVAGGRVFVTDAAGISAYQASTGHLAWRWTFPVPDDTLTPQLAVSGNTVVAASGDCHSNSDPDGDLTALNAATGKVVWHRQTDNPIATVAVDKNVVAISGDSPSDALTTIAFRSTDGKQLWSKPGYAASGVSANGRLLLTRGTTTSAAAITTGTLLWTRPSAWTAQSATPDSTQFLATAGSTLASISAADGTVNWTAPGLASPLIATDGRHLYRAAGRSIESLDARSGRHQWSRTLPADATQPSRAGGLLYTGGPILNAATGAMITSGASLAGQQVATGGHLYTVNGFTLSDFAP